MPIISDELVEVDTVQWWRVGRAASGPIVGENQHIDKVGMLSECHLQIAGTKVTVTVTARGKTPPPH